MKFDKSKLRREILSILLIAALILFGFDRAASYIHIPTTDSQRITIYTTVTCSYCKKLRNYLDENEIPYTDYDVE